MKIYRTKCSKKWKSKKKWKSNKHLLFARDTKNKREQKSFYALSGISQFHSFPANKGLKGFIQQKRFCLNSKSWKLGENSKR